MPIWPRIGRVCPIVEGVPPVSSMAFVVAAGLALTAVSMPPVLALLRRLHTYDHPNDRSSHDVPTLRGGGSGPWVAALLIASLATTVGGEARAGLLAAAVGFGALGLAEDVWGIPTLPRLVVQLLMAGTAAYLLHPLLPEPAAYRCSSPSCGSSRT